jgi:hypothetical protein
MKTPDFWTVYLLVFRSVAMVLVRLDQLGKQLEAVCADIKKELVHGPERKEEILRKWLESRKSQGKEPRRFWMVWGVIGIAGFGCKFFGA